MLYLIKSSKYLKIGFTNDLKSRLLEYDTHNPDYLLLDTCEGTQKDESTIHNLIKSYLYKNEWFYYNLDIIDIWKSCKNILESGQKLEKGNKKYSSELKNIDLLEGKDKIIKSLEYINNFDYRTKILLYLCDIVYYNSGSIITLNNFKIKLSKLFNIDYTLVSLSLNLFIRLGLLEGDSTHFLISKYFLKFDNSNSKEELILNVKKVLKLE